MSFRTIVKHLIPSRLFRTIEPWGHTLEAMLWSARYGFPARKLNVIGVTGTNGKTTTSFMIHRMLTEAGYTVGLLTTVANGVGNDITPQVHHMTTVSAPLLNRRLRDFARQKVDWVVLETTSHALAQGRVWGVPYQIAVLTNITHEHLDYHGTFERYVDAKRKLFVQANRHEHGYGVINADDPSCSRVKSALSDSITYGLKAGELRPGKLDLQVSGSTYTVSIGDETYNINCHIPGEFNVYNSLATVAVGRHIGLSVTQVEEGIAALTEVEGRMVTVDEGQDFSVIVDFAHTPDSFERLLSDVKQHTTGKLYVMFGSAGRRDETKRAIQGEIAGRYADEVVLTEEDDRDIDGLSILEQIAEGAKKAKKIENRDLFLIHDRSEAIKTVLSRASAGDTVMLLGKGHEKTIERADGEHLWDEVGEARRVLRDLIK